MALLLMFLLGIANFAIHKAVLESGHEMLGAAPFHLLGGKGTLLLEFFVLLLALFLVANGYAGWGWAYFAYSVFNAVAAWLILSRKI